MTKYKSMPYQPYSGYNIEICEKTGHEIGYAAFYHTQYYKEPAPDSEIIEAVHKIAETHTLHALLGEINEFVALEKHKEYDEEKFQWDFELFEGKEDEEDIL